MKNPSLTAASVLIGLAALVAGFAWMVSGGEQPAGDVALVPTTEASSEVGFAAVSPREQRKKANLEGARRDLKRIRETGEQVAPDLYMVPDDNGDPTYYYSELIEGRGRNGEPLFMTAQLKKIPGVPLKERIKVPQKFVPKYKKEPVQGVLSFGKKAAKGAGGGTGGGTNAGSNSSGGGDAGGSGDAGGGVNPGTPPKDD